MPQPHPSPAWRCASAGNTREKHNATSPKADPRRPIPPDERSVAPCVEFSSCSSWITSSPPGRALLVLRQAGLLLLWRCIRLDYHYLIAQLLNEREHVGCHGFGVGDQTKELGPITGRIHISRTKPGYDTHCDGHAASSLAVMASLLR